MSTEADVRRARRAFVLVGLVIPLLIAVAGLILMLVWLPAMPDTVAVHWNAAGVADGFAPAWTTPVFFAIAGFGVPMLVAGLGLLGGRAAAGGPTYRFLAAMSLGTTVFLTVLITWSFGLQRGNTGADDVASILFPLAISALLGISAGFGGWLLQPRVVVNGGAAAVVEPLALRPGERAVWLRTTTMARAGVIVIIGSIALVAALAVFFAVTGVEGWWVPALVALVITLLALATCVFVVRVDESGLRVTSPLGLPRFHVPLGDVASVSVVEVQAMAEFGGWGIRMSIDGRFGIVLHAGPAIQVVRHSGRVFVVTVADAETGAALLEALSVRDHS